MDLTAPFAANPVWLPFPLGKNPYYSPYCGLVYGPPLDHLFSRHCVFIHELAHFHASGSSISHLMRSIAGTIHLAMMSIAATALDHGLPAGKILIPSFSNWPFLRLRSTLLTYLQRSAALPEEIWANYATLKWLHALSVTTDLPLPKNVTAYYLAGAISFYPSTLPRFTEVLTRLAELSPSPSVEVVRMLTDYALNCDLHSLSTATSTQERSSYLLREKAEEDRNEELQNLIEKLKSRSWDSPEERFFRALAAVESFWPDAKHQSWSDLISFMTEQVSDFSDTQQRISDAPQAAIALHPTPNYPGPLATVLLGKLLAGLSSGRSSLVQSEEPSLFFTVDSPRTYDWITDRPFPPLYIEAVGSPPRLTLAKHGLGSAEIRLVTSLMFFESVRAQLSTGKGLVCPLDLISNLDHPDDLRGELSQHRRHMEGIWRAYQLDPGRDPEDWARPSCLG